MKCEACERGDHDQCGMQTWCDCDCDGPDELFGLHPMYDRPDICHCGLPESDHKYPGAAEHNFIPIGGFDVPTPPCRACGKPDDVISYPSEHSQTICPECCGKCPEHPDGENGHHWEHDNWERDDVCRYCGVLRRCTDDYKYD